MLECVFYGVFMGVVWGGETPQAQAVEFSNDMPMHSTMLGSLGGPSEVQRCAVGVWGGPREVPCGPQGGLGKGHFLRLEMNLAIIQRNMYVFSFGWFCEAVGGHCVMLLLYRLSNKKDL